MVGIESGLLMFPINILIITIFRSIRPRIVSKPHKDDSEGTSRPPAVTMPSILKVCFALYWLWVYYTGLIIDLISSPTKYSNFSMPVYFVLYPTQDTEEVISFMSRSKRSKISGFHMLESAADLLPALDRLHEFIQLMQGSFVYIKLLWFQVLRIFWTRANWVKLRLICIIIKYLLYTTQ